MPDALVKAGYDWRDGNFPGEQSDPAALRSGAGSTTTRAGRPPGEGEEFPGETSRFGALSLRVWSPLFEAEQGSW